MESLITDIVLQLLSYFAEEERSRIKTRQAEGIFIAKRKGVKFGRPSMEYPPEWDYYYSLWKHGKATAVETFTRLNLKKPPSTNLSESMKVGGRFNTGSVFRA